MGQGGQSCPGAGRQPHGQLSFKQLGRVPTDPLRQARQKEQQTHTPHPQLATPAAGRHARSPACPAALHQAGQKNESADADPCRAGTAKACLVFWVTRCGSQQRTFRLLQRLTAAALAAPPCRQAGPELHGQPGFIQAAQGRVLQGQGEHRRGAVAGVGRTEKQGKRARVHGEDGSRGSMLHSWKTCGMPPTQAPKPWRARTCATSGAARKAAGQGGSRLSVALSRRWPHLCSAGPV